MKIKFIYFILFFCLFGIFIFFWAVIHLPKDLVSTETKTFSVKKGEGTKEISINLEKEGLIRFGPLFRIYTVSQGVARKLQAGEYILSPSMTIPQIVEKLISGDVIKEKITIIEGWNLRDIGAYLENKGMFRAEELEKLYEMRELEGFLFPDTYEIKKGASLEEIIRKMQDNFKKKLTSDLRNEIKRQNKTMFEIITMASLIEKEVRTLKDKKLVSGILWKRLEAGIPLQVDATITYITGKKTTKVSIEEIQIDSPYNTYKYQGLPKGPICNPGLESILAVLYPEDSEYWYYLSTPEGETIFSKTLQEHNYAKSKYLK